MRSACRFIATILLVALGFGCAKSERRADETFAGPVVASAPQRIVVLGSSTSAGTGPRDPDDAYVPRYRAILARRFPSFTLLNLAVGGQTTYEIQPTGFVPPPNRPAPVVGKNISAALAQSPAAIIVNLPSNDTAANVSAAEQLENFARVAKAAADAGVLLWISTTQPRNFSAAQIAIQREVRSAILNRYSSHALDFWTPFAAADGTIDPQYDAGDGVHLNARAHSILLKIVLAAKVPDAVLAAAK